MRMRCHDHVPLDLLHDDEESDVVAAGAALLLADDEDAAPETLKSSRVAKCARDAASRFPW